MKKRAQKTIYDRIPDIDTEGLIILVRNWTNSVLSGDNKSGGYHSRCLARAILELERRGVLPCPSENTAIRNGNNGDII